MEKWCSVDRAVGRSLPDLVVESYSPQGEAMIKVRRLNKSELVVNAEMIEFVEATPDTIVSMISGKKIVVAESVDEIIERVVEYRKKCNQPLFGG